MSLERRVAVYGRNGRFLYYAQRHEARALVASFFAVQDSPKAIHLVTSPEPDDDSRHSTRSTVLHALGGTGYYLKPITRELFACGLVGART